MTDKEASARNRFTAFLIDKNTPGVRVGREIPVIGAMPTRDLILEDVELGDNAILGEIGKAFIPPFGTGLGFAGSSWLHTAPAWRND